MRKILYFLISANSALFSADTQNVAEFFLELETLRVSIYPNRNLHDHLIKRLNHKFGEDYVSLEDIDHLGYSVHQCMTGEQSCSFFSDSVKINLMGVSCRFCTANQSHKPNPAPLEIKEENPETMLTSHELALLELLTQRILDIVPPGSTVITLGRSPVLLGHMLRIGAHLGFRHAAMLNVVHVHFSGKPFSAINFDEPLASSSPLTPEELSFYFNYLDTQNFSSSTEELYIVDVLALGQSMNSFLRIFSSFWQTKFLREMPKIKILNMLNTGINDCDYIALKPAEPFEDEFGAGNYKSIDTRPWLTNIEITDLVPEDLLDRPAKEAFEKVRESIAITQNTRIDGEIFIRLFNRLINDDLQQAGGIYFPNKYWNDRDAHTLFEMEVSAPGRLHMGQIINLMHDMHLYFISSGQQHSERIDQKFETILEQLRFFLQIKAFRRGEYQIPSHVNFQPIGVKRKGY